MERYRHEASLVRSRGICCVRLDSQSARLRSAGLFAEIAGLSGAANDVNSLSATGPAPVGAKRIILTRRF